jgi:phosphoglycolate phosphatase-like HAD superfamily hydrolase
VGAKALAVATGTFTVEQLQQHQPDWAVQYLNQITAAAVV